MAKKKNSIVFDDNIFTRVEVKKLKKLNSDLNTTRVACVILMIALAVSFFM